MKSAGKTKPQMLVIIGAVGGEIENNCLVIMWWYHKQINTKIEAMQKSPHETENDRRYHQRTLKNNTSEVGMRLFKKFKIDVV